MGVEKSPVHAPHCCPPVAHMRVGLGQGGSPPATECLLNTAGSRQVKQVIGSGMQLVVHTVETSSPVGCIAAMMTGTTSDDVAATIFNLAATAVLKT